MLAEVAAENMTQNCRCRQQPFSNKLKKKDDLTQLESLADGMKTKCNYFVANNQPTGDTHSTWKERNSSLSE